MQDIIENSFGILASRFRVLLTTINLAPEKVSKVVLTCCYLHNFLIQKNKPAYLVGSADIENVRTGQILGGPWRSESKHLLMLQPSRNRNPQNYAKSIRNNFCTYFNTTGAVSWQWKMVGQTVTIQNDE